MNARDNSITIESLRAELNALEAKIKAYARQPQFPITLQFPTLRDGEKYVGCIVSADGTKREHIILLPGSVENVTHEQAMKWAAEQGGELPDRVEGSLLFSMKTSGHLAGEFEDATYWTREIHASDSGCAWIQNFSNGTQYDWGRDGQDRARAVRRLSI